MPYSTHFPLTLMVDHAVRLQPASVLDVGVGMGKWGFLFREALDFVHGRVQRDSWTTRIDGIEAVESNTSPLYEWVYDRVTIGDILTMSADIPSYDLVVLGDVLEHFDKEAGLRCLRALSAKSRNILISTPLHFFQQALGNPYEDHRSAWSQGDFAEWAYDYDVVGGFGIVVLLAGRDATWPDRKRSRVSRVVYAVPPLRSRGAAARVVKRLLDPR